MPLIPAIRPVNNISRTAESPISAPPMAADTRSEIGHDSSVGFDSTRRS